MISKKNKADRAAQLWPRLRAVFGIHNTKAALVCLSAQNEEEREIEEAV
jgi:hypothetical protein